MFTTTCVQDLLREGKATIRTPLASLVVMPGFRAMPAEQVSEFSEVVRAAEQLQAQGDTGGAIELYEQAIQPPDSTQAPLPAVLCGRLAALYRLVARYHDEVDLLERYMASQVTDDLRLRFAARLSRARSFAARHARNDSGALASVRAIPPTKKRKRATDGVTEPVTEARG